MTDIMALVYASPRDFEKWKNHLETMRQREPRAWADTPMLAELRPVLIRFHPKDKRKMAAFLGQYRPRLQMHGLGKHFRAFGLLTTIFRRILGRGWKKSAIPEQPDGWDFKFLSDVGVLPIAEREDDYKWGAHDADYTG